MLHGNVRRRSRAKAAGWYICFGRKGRVYSGRNRRSIESEAEAEALLALIRVRADETGSLRVAIADVPGRYSTTPAHPIGSQLPWQEEYRARIWLGAKKRAEKRGIEFDLDIEDLVIPDRCPVLGILLQPTEPGTGRGDLAPSVDRVFPERGYTKGNVVVVSWRANRIKNQYSAEELRRGADWLEYLESVPPLSRERNLDS